MWDADDQAQWEMDRGRDRDDEERSQREGLWDDDEYDHDLAVDLLRGDDS